MIKNLQWIVLIFALVIFGWFSIDVLNQTQWFGGHIDFLKGSQYGGLLSGMFSFLSVLLIFLTLKHQSDSYVKSAFENRFFQLIDYHRKNVEVFEYKDPSSKNGDVIKGQKVFINIHRELIKAINYLKNDLSINDITKILNDVEINRVKSENNVNDRNIDILELEIINLAYLIVFFGLSEDGRLVIERILQQRCEPEKIAPILNFFQNKQAKWDELSNTKKNDSRKKLNNHYKFFGGHQHRLGHYYRHIFQTINYIDKFKAFNNNYKIKYDYIKNYRAQFSTYEQAVFAFNSLSVIGRVWELNKNDDNRKLITKYNFIKNIPAEFISVFDLKKYYPDVEYEGYGITQKKREMKKKYK